METDVATKAEAFGWVPQEKFQGNPEAWVDAEVFVEQMKVAAPAIRKVQETFTAEIGGLRSQLNTVTQNLTEAQTRMQQMQTVLAQQHQDRQQAD